VGDIVTELSAQGIDLVKSGITYTLTANVEKLTLTGTNAINGTGNGMNNVLQGNSVANKLVGLAGADTLNGGGGNDILVGGGGKDVLTGGLGNDVFVFNSAPNAGTNLDTIKDYSAAADTIRLENAVFTQLSATGALSAGNFKVGTAAADANDYIIYTQSTGALYYDADANGAGAAVQIATVYASGTTPASLNAAEFVVI
jgi:Ca2+-binding RTX toxin-like protein